MSENSFPVLPITNASSEAIKAYRYYTDQLLGYGADLRALFHAADEEPGCALLQANAAALHLAFEGQEGWQQAAPYLALMRQSSHRLSDREQKFCRAVEAWFARDYQTTLNILVDIAREHPDDLVSIKWGQYHAFNLGDHDTLLKLGDYAVAACAGLPYIHGLRAFGLEQCHQVEKAEEEAMLAVEIALDDAWAHHAVAHVMETSGRPEEGAKWLGRCAHIWNTKGTFIREHNWWHLALFHLKLGNHQRVIDIFDEYLWGEWPEFPQEQIGAASMLWRLQLYGIEGGDRWKPVLHQARLRASERLFPFHDLHYLFALASAGETGEAEAHVQALEAHACHEGTCATWREAALPAAKGILAYSRGDCRQAEVALTQAMPRLESIGGSHAQRAIFQETLAAARRTNEQLAASK